MGKIRFRSLHDQISNFSIFNCLEFSKYQYFTQAPDIQDCNKVNRFFNGFLNASLEYKSSQ